MANVHIWRQPLRALLAYLPTVVLAPSFSFFLSPVFFTLHLLAAMSYSITLSALPSRSTYFYLFSTTPLPSITLTADSVLVVAAVATTKVTSANSLGNAVDAAPTITTFTTAVTSPSLTLSASETLPYVSQQQNSSLERLEFDADSSPTAAQSKRCYTHNQQVAQETPPRPRTKRVLPLLPVLVPGSSR